jgi:hypothetical protein
MRLRFWMKFSCGGFQVSVVIVDGFDWWVVNEGRMADLMGVDWALLWWRTICIFNLSRT